MEPIEQIYDDVWSLGHADAKNPNGNSFLVRCPAGSVMVGVPSFDPKVVEFLEKGGGLKWIFLTQRKDLGEAARFKAKFGCEVLLHAREAAGIACPVRAFEKDFPLAEKLRVFHTPGQTAGASCLLYEAHDGVLFSGDHILLPKGTARPVQFAWTLDWDQQMESAVKLLAFDFETILPGHGPWKPGLKGIRAKLERSLSEIESETV